MGAVRQGSEEEVSPALNSVLRFASIGESRAEWHSTKLKKRKIPPEECVRRRHSFLSLGEIDPGIHDKKAR